MGALELKIPPLVVVAVLACAMWLTTLVVAPFGVARPLRIGAGLLLAAAGGVVSLAGVVAFRRAHTTVDPTRPAAASALVTTGIYRFTRHPMYLGFLLALLGWALFLANGLALVVAAAFVPYMNRFQIGPEERMLAMIFGPRFDDYRRRVRRWL
jgi:protein-S-isoprenylcysteine O-methyltransferase Ste14